MKVSKAKVQENRARIVEVASGLFRERGYDGVGIADLMSSAGFTHGGFYKHFKSKADLMSEAAAFSLDQTAARAEGADPAGFMEQYMSRAHRDARGAGCTMAALCGDAARQSADVQAVFAAGVENLLHSLGGGTTAIADQGAAAVRARNMDVLARAVGAVVLSRACPDDSTLAEEILEVCRARALADLSDTKQK